MTTGASTSLTIGFITRDLSSQNRQEGSGVSWTLWYLQRIIKNYNYNIGSWNPLVEFQNLAWYCQLQKENKVIFSVRQFGYTENSRIGISFESLSTYHETSVKVLGNKDSDHSFLPFDG